MFIIKVPQKYQYNEEFKKNYEKQIENKIIGVSECMKKREINSDLHSLIKNPNET